jgi:hypothetical protein
VISKVCARGRRVHGLLYYLFTEGQAGEKHLSSAHEQPRVIAGFDDPGHLQPGQRANGRPDIRRLAGLLTQPLQVAGVGPDDRPVYHLVASAAKDPHTGQLRDRLLTDADWADIAAEYLHRLGFATRGDDHGVRWVAVRHADDHIHIVATLVRQDGKRVHPHNDYYTVRRASHAIEARYGLVSTAPADRTAAKRPTRAETEKLTRVQAERAVEGGPVPRLTDREQLRRHVRTAAVGSRTTSEFFTRLERSGVLVRLRYSEQNPGQVTGYAVALPDRSATPREPVWFGGGKLAPDLTLPKLQHRFAGADGGGQERLARGRQWTAGQVPARHRARPSTPAERHRAWTTARLAAARATGHVQATAHTDPAGAGDAAWATADLLAAVAHRVEGSRGGPLTDAAEAYDRAGRPAHRRLPAATPAGHGLRHAAHLLLGLGAALQTRDDLTQLAALLNQLDALIRAVEQLRLTQQHLAQARAARLAVQQSAAYAVRCQRPGVYPSTETGAALSRQGELWTAPPLSTTWMAASEVPGEHRPPEMPTAGHGGARAGPSRSH